MNWKKFFILVSVFLGLLVLFYFSEPKAPESNEVNFWKLDFEDLVYFPPKSGFEEMSSSQIQIQRKSIGLRENPIFLVTNIDKNTQKSYTYEGGYNVKNLYNDLSVLKTKTMAEGSPETLEKFQIGPSSPCVELGTNGKIEKRICFGKENSDKSARFAEADGFLISIHSYTADRFKGNPVILREKQLFTAGTSQLARVSIEGELGIWDMENAFTTKNSQVTQNWFRLDGKRARLNPNSGSRLDGILRGLYLEKFADELPIPPSTDFSSTQEWMKLEIQLSNGMNFLVRVFGVYEMDGVKYYPVQKSIPNIYESSLGFVKEDNLKELIQLLKTIKEEPEWKDPQNPNR